ncbi:hypothetical protein IJG22_01095, partial [Candidatus Saccharibacteria bacterium]|nr:hypothetical protein [Candidatus Saccharibacteria bacterium]
SVAEGTNVNYTKDYIVEDERDNKYYIVRKLYMRASDGTISTACWMTQDLDLDLVAQYDASGNYAHVRAYNRENNIIREVSTANSDMTRNWVTEGNKYNHMLYAKGGGDNSRNANWQTSYRFNTLASGASPVFPTATTTGNVISIDDTNSDNSPGMLDTGDIMFGPFDKTRSLSDSQNHSACTATGNNIQCAQFRNTRYFADEPSGHVVSSNAVGNYYNWYAATAGYGNSNVAAETNVSGSICPKGWGLPTGGSMVNTYSQLITAYFSTSGVKSLDGTIYKVGDNYDGYSTLSNLEDGSHVAFIEPPMSLNLSRGATRDAAASSIGMEATLWTSYYSSGAVADRIYVTSNMIIPGTNQEYKGRAFPIRCIQD